MNLRNVVSLCGLFLLFGDNAANSSSDSIITDDHKFCGYSEAEEDLCASYCFKSVKPPLAYIMELKEELKATTQAFRDKDKQLVELGKRLFEMNEWRDQVKANNQQIEYLRKTNEILLESLQRQNQIAKIEELNNQKSEIEHWKTKAVNNEESISAKLKQSDESLTDCKEYLSKKDQDLGKINEELRKTIDILRKSVEQQNHNHTTKIEELYTKINNQKAEIEELKSKATSNEERNALNNKQIEGNIIESESSSKRNESLLKTNEDLAKTNEDLRKTIEILKKTAELNTDEIKNQKAEIEDLKLKVAKGGDKSLKLEQVERNVTDCKDRIPRGSCKGLPTGIHFISISGLDPFPARCNGDIDGGGWLVIHRLLGDRTVFHRNWTDFRNGFGRLGGDFFIGLELLHRITNSGTYELYIQVEYPKGNFEFASYDNFRIGNEDTNYRLDSLGKSKGTLVDRLSLNLYQNFSTFDRDNDDDLQHCAHYYDGAWWYKKCDKPVFNFRYYSIYNTRLTAISSQPFQMLIRPTFNVSDNII